MSHLQRVTRAQVATHNNSSSTWVCIGNQVYDLTKFLDQCVCHVPWHRDLRSLREFQHPGGSEVLLKLAGHDATEQYEDIGHSTYARLMKEDYLVAEIADEEKMTYSYDKERFLETDADEPGRREPVMMDPTVCVAVLAVLFAAVYYFLFY